MSSPATPTTVCIINLKGGVGKSTITALLGKSALSRGLDVLTVDLDPQANLSQALMGRGYNEFLASKRPSIVEIFHGYLPPNGGRRTTARLGSGDAVETIGYNGTASLQLIPSRFDFSDNLTSTLRPNPRVLAKHLATHFRHKDLVLIDCAPTESVLTQAAYHASGLVLVPVKPEFFATIGFPLLRQSLENFRNSNFGHVIEVAGVVINNAFYDGGNDGGPEKARSVREIQREAKKNGWHIFRHQIPFSRGFPKLMRGDPRWLGNAEYFYLFANDFFDRVGF